MGAAASEDEDDGKPGSGDASALAAYVANPSPGTVVVFQASRFDFEGEDKARIERVQKFYSAIPEQVEFRAFTIENARALAIDLARERGLKIGTAEIGLLVEALGGEASRIASEIEKLALFAGTDRKVTPEDIAALVPDARETTIFALVRALGAGNRARSLDALDALVRDGEYLPLALRFLAAQFRLAIVAREAICVGVRHPAALYSRRRAHLERSRRTGSSDGERLLEGEAGNGDQKNLRGRPGAQGHEARRPYRNGRTDSCADERELAGGGPTRGLGGQAS